MARAEVAQPMQKAGQCSLPRTARTHNPATEVEGEILRMADVSGARLRGEADRLYAALSDGGSESTGMTEMPWDCWGCTLDRYGIRWMFNVP